MNFFASEDEDAENRFKRFYSSDPFPDIPPALLNSGDIRSYVGATGMICPFNEKEEAFKTASYEVDLLGKCVFWNDDGEKIVKNIGRGDEFILRPNSIAFVTLEPIFRLPRYIAIRFNLKITHVYRGILLGTGPLVDPGYRNRLSIPLHNLTTNDYVFRGGDGLIWVEFTKLHDQEAARAAIDEPRPPKWPGKIAEFPERKNKLNDVEDYIRKGEPHRPVRSSIPEVFHNAEAIARDVRDKLKSFSNRFEIVGIAAIIVTILAIFVTIVWGVYPIVSLVHEVNNTADAATGKFDSVTQQMAKQIDSEKQLRAEVERLRGEIAEAKARSRTSNGQKHIQAEPRTAGSK